MFAIACVTIVGLFVRREPGDGLATAISLVENDAS